MLTGKVPFQGFNSNQINRVGRALELAAAEKSKLVGKLITQYWSKDPAEPPAFTDITRRFRQGEVEFDLCEKVDWHHLGENYCPPLSIPDAQECYEPPSLAVRMLSMEFYQ
jgi:hypothetical protein